MKPFIRQIKYEVKNIVRSKFLLILGCILIAAGILIPALAYINEQQTKSQNGPDKPYPTYVVREAGSSAAIDGKYPDANGNGDTITIDGITIRSDNPFYWNLYQLQDEKRQLESGMIQMTHPESVDVMLEVNTAETAYYLRFAKSLTNYQDYRSELAWSGVASLYDRYIFSHPALNADVLVEVFTTRKGGFDPSTFNEKYVNITDTRRQEGLEKAENALALIYDIVDNDNFAAYIDYKMGQANDQIASLEKNIAIQEKAILENPSQEDSLNQIIEEYKRQIKVIRESTIPMLQYRLEKNIRPGANVWQNNALNDIENSQSQLSSMTIMTEEEFNKNGGSDGKPVYPVYDYYYPGQYTTYKEYVAYMQRQIDQLNKTIIIARKSLDSNKPDMKYVPAEARYRVNGYLDYSIFVALFAVLLGGWLIASEYQQGTIRLLMIRPKTRLKILFAKFTAALIVLFVVDVAGSLVNMVANGAFFGFADYLNPNYNVAGPVGFAAYYLPRFLACFLPIAFSFAAAFLLSVLLRNTAVAIVLPMVFFIASLITLQMIAYSPKLAWLALTPLPYLQLSAFFRDNSPIMYAQQNGIAISLTYGILLLVGLAAVFTALAAFVFKKRDITN
jgi:ABC-2 type transport system permease protein